MVLVVGAVLAPVSEELFYRGMIYPLFRKHLGPMWGSIISGIIFGLAHLDLWRAIPLALGGIVLCYIYEKSGSILVSILAHGVWNGVMSILIYLSLSYGAF
jgi:membrane protease YdiL (CAAX protease family)